MKSNIQKRKRAMYYWKKKILTINSKFDDQTKKAIDDVSQPGASSWLNYIPLEQYGFSLNKAEFRDAILLRHEKELKGLPATCPCGQKYNTTDVVEKWFFDN